MKTRKKVWAAFALSLLLVLTACTPILSEETDRTAPNDGTAAQTAPPKLVMATDPTFAPYEYNGDQGMAGIDIDIAHKIAQKLGLELEIKSIPFNDIISAVQNKQVDIGMAALTADETRLAAVNFSSPYATGKQVIIVGKDSDITVPAGLAGKRIGVQQNTAASTYCAEDFGTAAMQSFSTGTEAIQALLQGGVDAVVTDADPAAALAQLSENLVILDTEYKLDKYAIAVNKDNASLLKKINSALAELKASGEIRSIIDSYIKAE